MSDRVNREITAMQAQDLDRYDLEQAAKRREAELALVAAVEAERFRGLQEPLRIDPAELQALYFACGCDEPVSIGYDTNYKKREDKA